ncbi:MAG: UxaA family hydrolase [Planctomycetes bacterium]|nr:UxaA family hydrolase [Planctomycetota bacterium]
MTSSADTWQGYPRNDGRKGVRNVLVVAYLVECAHHVSAEIAAPFRDRDVQVIGFGGCYPNSHADRVMKRLCTHPNVGAVLLVSLGCESFNKWALQETVAASGRPVATLVIQDNGGTAGTVAKGQEWVRATLTDLANSPRCEMGIRDLTIGGICGGSDATSGISGNPATGLAFDRLVAAGAVAIFEETGEMIGCEDHLASRAATPALAIELQRSIQKAAAYYSVMGHASFAPGNADGGLSTIEEKSLGAYSKSGSAEVSGLLKPGDIPTRGGLYLLDVVPDGEPRFGFPNINDNAEISELIACGCHLILFITGRGSVVGSAISPVIKICANPDTFARMADDMDVNAGKVLTGEADLAGIADEIMARIRETSRGTPSASERLGHREFVLQYKSFQPAGPACLP